MGFVYCRVSTSAQMTDKQLHEIKAAGFSLEYGKEESDCDLPGDTMLSMPARIIIKNTS